MVSIQVIPVDAIPKSVDFSKYLLVGLKNGSIIEFDIQKNAKEVIMHSHHDGEVWGMCVIPNQNKFITSGDDNKLLLYDITDRKCIGRGNVIVET
jgi:WD40 repeat protein